MSPKINILSVLISASVICIISCNEHTQSIYPSPAVILSLDSTLNPVETVGKQLFFDANLSNPPGQSCAGCHSPGKAFVDPGNTPVSAGAIKTLFGNRNAPSVTYAAYTPYFHYDSIEKGYVGGLFWDGRANTLSDQAMQPLLNHLEMNMDKKTVVEQVRKSVYKNLFLSIYGSNSLDDVDKAYEYIGEALEEYEETKALSPFTSKFDYYMKGKVQLTEQETRGLKLFEDSTKGNCAACHTTKADKYTGAILFTDYTYDNIGVPINPEISKLCKEKCKPDLGLGAIVKRSSENGKFKVPTLRNVAVTGPYFHNGVFKTLTEAVQFYNERDSGNFGTPEVLENLNKVELGNLKLNEQEVKDIVAFMETLTDGYNVGVKK
jgi:cytochrome c peroxidase